MAYANQVIGGGDGAADRTAARRRPGRAGSSSPTSRPTRAAPFEAVARDAGLAVVYLVAPTTEPDRRARIAARTGGFLYCVSLVGVTGARASLPRDRRPARPRRPGRQPGPGRGRVRRQPAGPRPGARRARAPTASSSPRRSSTRSGRTAATSTRSAGSSRISARRPGATSRLIAVGSSDRCTWTGSTRPRRSVRSGRSLGDRLAGLGAGRQDARARPRERSSPTRRATRRSPARRDSTSRRSRRGHRPRHLRRRLGPGRQRDRLRRPVGA